MRIDKIRKQNTPNLIIQNIHSSYWQDLLVLYDEMIELDPNSIWHKQEREMVKKVVLELENNNVYITGKSNV